MRTQWEVEGQVREVRGKEEDGGEGGEHQQYGDGTGSGRAPPMSGTE